MDDKLLLYNNSEPTLDAASKRKIAVDIALELTRQRIFARFPG